MDAATLKNLAKDPDGLLTYEYIANHIGVCSPEDLSALVDNMVSVDSSGQFIVSAARYLHAIDPVNHRIHIDQLVGAAIERDRERRYIADLLPAIWGPDYAERAASLCTSDDNFRRIYKRLYPAGII